MSRDATRLQGARGRRVRKLGRSGFGYKNLREAERSFRDLKTTLELRPVFHRLEHRFRAHVVVCWLALLLIRLAERKTGQSWRRIATELSRLPRGSAASPAPARVRRGDDAAHSAEHQ